MQGSEVAAFEDEFSQLVVEGRTCVAVNSGTSALHLGLLAAGVGPGDEVIVPAFTFAATANAVAMTGAEPVFADISLDDFCIDPASIESVISSKTVGIMPVHLFGQPAQMGKIAEIASKNGLAIFEDAAQAHTATYENQSVGTFGSFAAFSFYATKNMTAGEGGMVVCEDDAFARKIRLLRNQGMEKRYDHEAIGLNNRLSDIHAAIGRVQLRKLIGWTRRRKENAGHLTSAINGVVTPKINSSSQHVFHQYTVRIPRGRDDFSRKLLQEFGIGSAVYYPTPASDMAPLRNFRRAHDMAGTNAATNEVLSLPVHPSLRKSELNRIARAVNELVEASNG